MHNSLFINKIQNFILGNSQGEKNKCRNYFICKALIIKVLRFYRQSP